MEDFDPSSKIQIEYNTKKKEKQKQNIKKGITTFVFVEAERAAMTAGPSYTASASQFNSSKISDHVTYIHVGDFRLLYHSATSVCRKIDFGNDDLIW